MLLDQGPYASRGYGFQEPRRKRAT
jgi:hypothetical protein